MSLRACCEKLRLAWALAPRQKVPKTLGKGLTAGSIGKALARRCRCRSNSDAELNVLFGQEGTNDGNRNRNRDRDTEKHAGQTPDHALKCKR